MFRLRFVLCRRFVFRLRLVFRLGSCFDDYEPNATSILIRSLSLDKRNRFATLMTTVRKHETFFFSSTGSV